jgi:hypothetical protein
MTLRGREISLPLMPYKNCIMVSSQIIGVWGFAPIFPRIIEKIRLMNTIDAKPSL